ncbi:hypothetical protein [Nisaea nitritireducens]|uniref:hypothetical protein n=1 Tax=Nisaea nitritireducens TaxID=568392 RepID=UPI001D01E07A|nr:hypothetical protein [Nisaea nitritireducens]
MVRRIRAAGFVHAVHESVGYQTRDLLEAKRSECSADGGDFVLRVDAGMVASDWTMQFLADILAAPADHAAAMRCGGRLRRERGGIKA